MPARRPPCNLGLHAEASTRREALWRLSQAHGLIIVPLMREGAPAGLQVVPADLLLRKGH